MFTLGVTGSDWDRLSRAAAAASDDARTSIYGLDVQLFSFVFRVVFLNTHPVVTINKRVLLIFFSLSFRSFSTGIIASTHVIVKML